MQDVAKNISPFQSRESYERAVSSVEEVVSKRIAIKEKVRNVFGTNEGQEVLNWICEQLCGERRSCFSDNSLEMARRCGRFEVAETLRGIIENEDEKNF